jgi:hypothetical protein
VLSEVVRAAVEMLRTLPLALSGSARSLVDALYVVGNELVEVGAATLATLGSLRSLLPQRPARSRPVRTDIPRWALVCLGEEAERYAREWAAHLHERVEDGEIREAKRDRRRLVRRAVAMGLSSQLRTVGRLRRKRS